MPDCLKKDIWKLMKQNKLKVELFDELMRRRQKIYRRTKGQKSWNDFFNPTFPPKNKQMNSIYYYETSGWLVYINFLEEIEDTEKTFRNYLTFRKTWLLRYFSNSYPERFGDHSISETTDCCWREIAKIIWYEVPCMP